MRFSTFSEAQPYSSAWDWINWLTVISLILGLIFSYSRVSGSGASGSGPEFIAANVQFYGFLFITILFLWNWFGISSVGQGYTAASADVRAAIWIIVDAIHPLLTLAMGVHLLRSSASE